LPEFAPSREISWNVAVDDTAQQSKYEMIIGRDLQLALGMDILFSTKHLKWDGIVIPMRTQHTDLSYLDNRVKNLGNSQDVFATASTPMSILDAKYEKANIDATINTFKHLNSNQQQQLKALLYKFEHLFDGTLGDWNTEPVSFKLKEGAKPFQLSPFPVPKIHEDTLKKEIQRLCNLGVLKPQVALEYQSPSFIIPKKNGTVRVVSDFRVLNSKLQRVAFPIPRIQDILTSLNGFTYATSIDLNMGYYTIRLTPQAQKLCTIVFPWGKYSYLRLPMGVANSPDIFQSKISQLMVGLDFVRAYLDDVLVATKGSYQEHLLNLEQVLVKLDTANLRINIEKCTFATQEFEYLGYLVTTAGIRPLPSKVEAILQLKAPKTLKQLRSFLGLVNYYRDMWKRRSHLLTPLTEVTKVPRGSKTFKWAEAQDKAFHEVKKVITQNALLKFPDFNKVFDIHTDASDYQLGAVISQEGQPIAFYSRKLTETQRNYTVGEREMLSIVETLNEFRTMLLGYRIKIYTDHENLTRLTTVSKSPRIQRWRWTIEEFGPTIEYIKGPRNVVADALSRLDTDVSSTTTSSKQIAELYENTDDKSLQDLDYPLSTQIIAEHQLKDQTLIQNNTRHPEYFSKSVDGHNVILFNNKIYIPKTLRKPILSWYHSALQHPGIQRTERTIRSHLVWPGLSKDVEKHIKSCHQCQRCKNPRKKYGHLSLKDIDQAPWDTICVDLIGPYTVTTKHEKELSLQAITMCDPATGWFEVAEIKDKTAEATAKILDQTWFCRYPRPKRCISDNGNEFLGKEFQELLQSYGVKSVPTTVRNPQANFVERVHQTLGNMLRSHELEDHDFDYQDPWSQILANCAWAIRSTVHTVLNASPAQIVFGRDMLFDLSFTTEYKEIKKRKQEASNANTHKENSKRIKHEYKVNDQVLLDRGILQRKLIPKREGPYQVVRVYSNGTLKIRKGIYVQRVSIRRCVPYVIEPLEEANVVR
jgi:hypothetical protein